MKIDTRELQKMKQKFNLSIQPFVVAVEETQKLFVVIDERMFECNSMLSALDSVLKFCLSFNIEYNFECDYVWEIFQFYVYDIKTKFDKHKKTRSQ